MKIIVLGGGLVGAPMVRDLAADRSFEVTVADRGVVYHERVEVLS
jgi:saccharopine dehydrogenase-like NADP-dependent oxidoreductase